MASYTTSQGDRLDWVCFKYYGTERGGTVEAVLAANRGLADYGADLPAGLTIDLPDLPAPAAEVDTIRLWD